ncbi:hypothetical protein BDQ17DRAFT_307921 [Cyathus striatus]|nr:hypothetical protein BDQ17DRAFT_307921 [Cyathus striatus]
MRVPIEIAQSIIDEVALVDDDNHSALKSCSLVCKAFARASRRYIFHSVSLTNAECVEGSYEMYLRFCSAITTSPDLAHYVRELYIFEDVYYDRGLLDENDFPEILGMLQNIAILNLSFRDNECNWFVLSQSSRQSLVSMLSSHRLERLYLKGVYNLHHVVARCIAAIPMVHVACVDFQDSRDSDDLMYGSLPIIDSRGGLKCLSFVSMSMNLCQPLIDALSSPECCKVSTCLKVVQLSTECDSVRLSHVF